MAQHNNSDDLSESEQPIRARVPDHVAGGAFSTGVIVMTAHSEFILDFVQNLGRPHSIVARVVMPHHVLPQLVDALRRNMELYRNRWGNLPDPGMPPPTPLPWSASAGQGPSGKAHPGPAHPPTGSEDTHSPATGGGGTHGPGMVSSAGTPTGGSHGSAGSTSQPQPAQPANVGQPTGGRQQTAQDIYDDLKIRDEILSGSYANAVMIGHGPHEFSFDFITNFYPSSSVSARVFLAAGQIPRLFDSLSGTWNQLRARTQPGGPQSGGQPSPPPRPENPDSDSSSPE